MSSIVLADDHQFLLDGLMAILKEDSRIEIVATAKNGVELLEAVATHSPDLVVLDLNMPGYDGIECLKKIKNIKPNTKVLILTNYSQPELIEEVKKNQADGFLVKNTSAAILQEAIQVIIRGGIYFPALHALQPVAENSPFYDAFLKKYQLTKREVEVIKLVCKEMTTKEIASTLFLSELTVHTHRRNILRKLDIKNAAGLVNFAKQNQLI